MAINSRTKGATYERKIAKLLSEATGGSFKRTPGSGALGTSAGVQAMQGDLYNADWMDKNPWFFELKKYESINHYHFMQNMKSCLITKWLLKMQEQQAEYQTGVLIFEENRGKSMVIVEQPCYPEYSKTKNTTVFTCNDRVYQVMLFTEFLIKYKGKLTK